MPSCLLHFGQINYQITKLNTLANLTQKLEVKVLSLGSQLIPILFEA